MLILLVIIISFDEASLPQCTVIQLHHGLKKKKNSQSRELQFFWQTLQISDWENYEGHPKSFRLRHIRQQYFPQFIHQWNVHSLLTYTSLVRIWRRNLWHHRALNNKKSELMLTRHARAYSSSCSQVVLVYLYSFHRNSLLCNQNRQKITKSLYFGVQDQSRSSILTILRSSSLVLVILSRMSVLICNHFHVRQASSG